MSELIRKHGLRYAPNREDVDLCLKAIQQEDDRQKEALRRHLLRERAPLHVTGLTLLKFFVYSVLGLGFVFYVLWVWPALERTGR